MSTTVIDMYQQLLARRRELGRENFEAELDRYLTGEAVCIEADSLPWGGVWTGPAGYADMFAVAEDLFVGLAASGENPATMYVDGPAEYAACVDGRILRSYTLGIEVGGRTLKARSLEVYSFADGKISSIDVFFHDTASINEILGWPGSR